MEGGRRMKSRIKGVRGRPWLDRNRPHAAQLQPPLGHRRTLGLLTLLALAAASGCSDDRGDTDLVGPPLGDSIVVRTATVPIPPNYGIHDMVVRDGIVVVSAWNSGVILYDIGGGAAGGTPAIPVELATYLPDGGTISGRIHNAWWFHNPNTGERRYLFLGQEGPGEVGSRSSGDIFVLDVSDLEAPVQVSHYTLPEAGAHNFWMDEEAEILYAAFYTGGVVAFDVSGTLPADLAEREIDRVLPGEDASYVWGVHLHRGSLYATDMERGFYQLRLQDGSLEVLSGGDNVNERFSSDLWLHGDHAYTGTWGQRAQPGDVLKIWALEPDGAPVLADSLGFSGIMTVSDVEVSADGRLLLVSTEGGAGAGVQLYALEDPLRPRLLWFEGIDTGVHTITFGAVGGRSYVFGAKNPFSPALLIWEITELLSLLP